MVKSGISLIAFILIIATFIMPGYSRIIYDYKVKGIRDDFRIGFGSCFRHNRTVNDTFKYIN